MTFEFGENEHKMPDYITDDRAVEIAQAMGASQVLELEEGTLRHH